MGLFSWLFGLFGGSANRRSDRKSAPDSSSLPERNSAFDASSTRTAAATKARLRPRLIPSRAEEALRRRQKGKPACIEVAGASPYRFARFGSRTGQYLDLGSDGDDVRLQERGLPIFRTPDELAEWLGLPLNKVAWLVHRFSAGHAESPEKAHYHYTWCKKRSGGFRLIESPKQTLKQAQIKILREILDRVAAHPAAHGFVTGRSILTNASAHVGQGIVVKFDLTNFYTTVGFSRVVAIFRTLGYSREAAIWLGLLTTTAAPGNLPFDRAKIYAVLPYFRRHLPQGAPTSPALANLSAYHLDARLSGMARAFGAQFTRYADDLTFSGPVELATGLRTLIPLVEQIIRRERFQSNRDKRQVLRANQRQSIAGVVVNAKTNISRAEFDKLKAILTNCVRSGPSTQNRHGVDDFAAHLRGRIAHVLQLNAARGQRLLEIYNSIDWRR